MTRLRFCIATLTALAFLLAAVRCSAAPADELQKVAPEVYVSVRPFPDRFNDSNATIIILDDSVVVVDTQTTLTTTREVLAQIRKLTDKPVRWVINTHWHGDHVQGNQVYREAFPGVQFVAQQNTREDMAQRAAAELKDDVDNLPARIDKYRQMLASGLGPGGKPLNDDQKGILRMRVSVFSKQLPDLRQTRIVLPDLTFDDSLTLYASGGREIRMIHYAGHTRGDAAVYLPVERILITGDLLDDMPYTGDGSPVGLVKTLHDFDRLDFNIIIPGHGGIERDREHLHQVTALFESIVAQVQEAVRSGLSIEDTKKKVSVEQFRVPLTGGEEHATHAFDGFVPAAIERAYLEAKGPTTK
jgi:cyclase